MYNEAYTGVYLRVCAEWNLENKQRGLGTDNVRNKLLVKAASPRSITTKKAELSLPANKTETPCCAEYTDVQRAERGLKKKRKKDYHPV